MNLYLFKGRLVVLILGRGDEGEGVPNLSANIGDFNMIGLKLEKMLLLNKFKCVQKCCMESRLQLY